MGGGFSFLVNGKHPAMSARVPKTVVVGAAVCAAAVVVLGIMAFGHRPIGLDLPIATWVADRGGDGLVFRVLTHLGATITVCILGIVVGLFMFVRTRSPWPMVFVVVTIAGEIVLNNAVKGVVDRPRPTLSQIVTPVGSSFPSGHSAAAAAA
jgi:membrane-associated phospholipid phosphatase